MMRGARAWVCLAGALFAVSSCERAGPEKQPAAAESLASESSQMLRRQAGSYYFDFSEQPGLGRYAAENLGLSPQALARFRKDMDVTVPSSIVAVGGVEALVFRGCMAHNCPDAKAVLAIDLASGDAFVAVRDEQGAAILKPNSRLEALLTETSPSGHWADPASD